MSLLHGITGLWATPASALIVLHSAGAAAGAFLILGVWTPVAGAAVAIVNAWIAWSSAGDRASILLAVLGATLAMIGPGAWSVDARLFGRKRIESSEL